MEKNSNLKFESPSFSARLKGMLGVDFYRLFHTPLFYIFLAIAAIIPAMILGMTSIENPQGVVEPLYTNTWQVIAAEKPLYVVSNIAQYANMNMVFILLESWFQSLSDMIIKVDMLNNFLQLTLRNKTTCFQRQSFVHLLWLVCV